MPELKRFDTTGLLQIKDTHIATYAQREALKKLRLANFMAYIRRRCTEAHAGFMEIDFESHYDKELSFHENEALFREQYPNLFLAYDAQAQARVQARAQREAEIVAKEEYILYEHEELKRRWNEARLSAGARKLLLMVKRGFHDNASARLKRWGVPFQLATTTKALCDKCGYHYPPALTMCPQCKSTKVKLQNPKYHFTVMGTVRDGMMLADRLRQDGVPARYVGLKTPVRQPMPVLLW